MADKTKVPEASTEATGETSPEKTEAEKSTNLEEPKQAGSVPAVSQKEEAFTVPKKFEGKPIEEVVKAYLEAEKKLSEVSTRASKAEEYEKTLQQWTQLGRIIEGNTALYKAVEEEVRKVSGNTETKTPQDDTKVAMQDIIINDFEKNYGLDTLSAEKRQVIHRRIGEEVAGLYDPTGKTKYYDAVREIPTSKLRTYLDKAYKLATIDDAEERGRLEGMLQVRQNSEASMGSMSASSGQSGGVELTEAERATAKKMGIAEKDYATMKQKIQEGK